MMVKKLTSFEKNFHSISSLKPLKKGVSIALRKLSYTVLLLSTLFFVRCGTSDTVDAVDTLGTLDAKDTDALLNKITLNNEQVKEENLNNELTLYLGEKFVFNIPQATELFDADKNNNTQIKAKIINQEDLTMVTLVIEDNTLTINPKKIGSGSFTLTYTTSYNNLGVLIDNKIKKIISDSFTKKINYRIIHNLNEMKIPENFPKTITVAQHLEKKITLPTITDKLRNLVVPEDLPMENDLKLTLLDNTLTITSATIGTRTITLKYKTLEKTHTDNRLFTAITQSLDITIITEAQVNTIAIPNNFPTTLTVTQNVPRTISLPVVIDSFGTEISGSENIAIATINGILLTIISPTIGTKNITLTYTSQATFGKTATTKTKNILLTTKAPIQNTITIPDNFVTTFTVTQNVPKTLGLPEITDSVNTAITPTVNVPIARLRGNSLIITSPTTGTKTITLTYTSQAINGKATATQTVSILLTTVASTQNTIVFPNNFPTTFTVTQTVADTLTLPTVTDSFNTEILPTVNDPVATLTRNVLNINSSTIGTKTISLTYTSQAISSLIASTNTAFIRLITVPFIPLKNELRVVDNIGLRESPRAPPFKGLYALFARVGPNYVNSTEILTVNDLANEEVIPTFSFESTRISVSTVKEGNKHKIKFQYLGGTGNEVILVDIIWTSKPKTINGKRYDLEDTYTNSITVRLTDKVAKKLTFLNDIRYTLNGRRRTLRDRDGEVIKIDLGIRGSTRITSLPFMFPIRGSKIVPTMTLSNESVAGLTFVYSNSICIFCPIPGINVYLGRTMGSGVIKVVYKSEQVLWPWSDIDGDGADDNTLYTPVTITLYIEVNGAKKEDATFPDSN